VVARELGAALERLAGGYERDPDARRDLLQDIHVALWRSLARYDGRCSLRTWVYRVAHNTAISRVLRPRASARTLVAIDEDLDAVADAVDREHGFDRQRALDRLHRLIQRLRPLDRQVMLLYFEDEDAASIAEIIVGRAIEGRPASQVAAVIVAAVALFVGVLWVIARGRHQIEREIDALERQ